MSRGGVLLVRLITSTAKALARPKGLWCCPLPLWFVQPSPLLKPLKSVWIQLQLFILIPLIRKSWESIMVIVSVLPKCVGLIQ